MTPHDHRTFVEGCFRCELGRDEVATDLHRCWGCGKEGVACGFLCVDCSWEEHLAGLAHTGEFDEPKEGTPACCLASRLAARLA